MSSRRIGALLLGIALPAASVLPAGCQSREALATKKAFVVATYEKQLAAPPKTWAELRLDLDRALREDVEVGRALASARIERMGRTYRWVYVAGGALAIAGSLQGANSESGSGGWIATGAGAATALGGFAVYQVAASKLEACRVFLAQAGHDLSEWGKESLKDSAEEAPPEVARELYRRIYVIRAEPRCLPVR